MSNLEGRGTRLFRRRRRRIYERPVFVSPFTCFSGRKEKKERNTRRGTSAKGGRGGGGESVSCAAVIIFSLKTGGDQSVRPISLENTDEDATYARFFPFLFVRACRASRIHGRSFVKSCPFCAKFKFRETAIVGLGRALACKSHHYYQLLNGVSWYTRLLSFVAAAGFRAGRSFSLVSLLARGTKHTTFALFALITAVGRGWSRLICICIARHY